MRHKRPAFGCYRTARDVMTGVTARDAILLPLLHRAGVGRREDHFKSVWEKWLGYPTHNTIHKSAALNG
jgi:hypothetical protein